MQKEDFALQFPGTAFKSDTQMKSHWSQSKRPTLQPSQVAVRPTGSSFSDCYLMPYSDVIFESDVVFRDKRWVTECMIRAPVSAFRPSNRVLLAAHATGFAMCSVVATSHSQFMFCNVKFKQPFFIFCSFYFIISKEAFVHWWVAHTVGKILIMIASVFGYNYEWLYWKSNNV